MDTTCKPPSDWTEIEPDLRGLWIPGLWALFSVANGRRYVCAVNNIGKRIRDHHVALRRRSHWNSALQADWTSAPEDFGWYVIRTTRYDWTLPLLRQQAIAEARGLTYNRRKVIAPSSRQSMSPIGNTSKRRMGLEASVPAPVSPARATLLPPYGHPS